MTVKVKTEMLAFVELPAVKGWERRGEEDIIWVDASDDDRRFGIARVGRRLYVNEPHEMQDGHAYFAIPVRLASRLVEKVKALKVGETFNLGGALLSDDDEAAAITIRRLDRYHIHFTPPCGEHYKIRISDFTRTITSAVELPSSNAKGVAWR